MEKYKKKNPTEMWITIIMICVVLSFIFSEIHLNYNYDYTYNNEDEVFRIISSTSTSKLDQELIDYGEEIGLDVEIE